MPTSMLTVVFEVIRHTPQWVGVILAAIVGLGVLQLRDHSLARLRVVLLPVGLGVYSLWGTASVFGVQPLVLAAWSLGWGATLMLGRQVPWAAGVRHDAASNRFHLPGSVLPLLLMLGVFAVRYVVAVTLAFHRDWAADAAFAGVVSAVYGALSGLLAARAMCILGSARRAPALAGA
jgi:hypothetical protein